MSYFYCEDKKIYYKEIGQGKPLIMIHGDTASSVMFEMLLPLYQNDFHVILIDLLGNGKSDRVNSFPSNLWITQADQVIALIEHLKLTNVNVLGTSGGAWVAINAALKRPDLVNKVIADSFDGRNLHEGFANNLLKERKYAKQDNNARQFYEWCQGDDWEYVVNLNTQALIECAIKQEPLFFKPLEALEVPILFIGSNQDDMCRKDMFLEYEEMSKLIADGTVCMFDFGGHPAIVSNAEEFSKNVLNFLQISL